MRGQRAIERTAKECIEKIGKSMLAHPFALLRGAIHKLSSSFVIGKHPFLDQLSKHGANGRARRRVGNAFRYFNRRRFLASVDDVHDLPLSAT